MICRIRLLTTCVGMLLFFSVGIPVQAVTFNAGNATELIQALHNANDESTNPGADTINLTASIPLNAVANTTEGNNGLPVISSEIIINGAGFTIERDTGTNTPLFRIFYVQFGGDLTLNNITIRNGSVDASVSASNSNGGGIFNRGTLTIENNSMIFDNTATDGNGGSIYNVGDGILTVNNSIVSDNTATRGGGGGIYNAVGGTLTIISSQISGNTATNDSGGGINNYSGTLTIKNSIISENTATYSGGGIHNFDFGNLVNLTIENSTISGNSANYGGGTYNISSTTEITDSTIVGNTASETTSSDGGGMYNDGNSTLTLTNSTVSGNTASRNGGGIYNSAMLTLLNSTLSGNTANSGGGIRNFAGLTLSNSIIANSPSGDDYSGSTSTLVLQGNNIVETGLSGVNNTDPQLAPLADNDGFTQTHALLSGSPAINASGTGATTTDQRGVPAAGTRDIGAYEFMDSDVNNDGIVSPVDAMYVLNRLNSGDSSADVDGDSNIDMDDFNAVLATLGN